MRLQSMDAASGEPTGPPRASGTAIAVYFFSFADRALARDLFEALRALRRTLAEERGVPPYVVFHDATLAAIAAAQPRNLDALSTIAGIGAKKLERYGPALLQLLKS